MPKIRKGGAAEMGTLQGVAVHRPKGGGATTLGCPVPPPRLGYTLATRLVAFSDPRTTQTCCFLLQVDPNQLQQLLLCKYANTTKYTTSCACMLAFHKHFVGAKSD